MARALLITARPLTSCCRPRISPQFRRGPASVNVMRSRWVQVDQAPQPCLAVSRWSTITPPCGIRASGLQPLDASWARPFQPSSWPLLGGPAPMTSPFYAAEHEAYREVVRRFVAREIEPYASEWDEAGEFPRELYAKAAAIGLLALGFPEEFGGVPADQFMRIVAAQELARAGAGGIGASLMSHSIGCPPIARAARAEIRARVLPQVLRGEKISALAITEPGGGSDVASLRTKARRDGDHYLVSGE